MKRIIVVRHAKAVPYGYEDDFHRNLTDRGRKDAAKVSSHMASLGISPELMVSSPASRALQTAGVFASNLDYKKAIVTEPGLYMDFSTGEFVEFIQEIENSVNTVFVFGHNPAISFYASRLAGNFHGDMPTCSTVVIDFEADDWHKVESRKGSVVHHFVPAMFR